MLISGSFRVIFGQLQWSEELFQITKCDLKVLWMFKETFITVRHIAINLPQSAPLYLEPTCPVILALAKAVPEVFFRECLYLCCCGCLEVLNQLKTSTFCGHFVFQEESAVTRCQAYWMRGVRIRMFSWPYCSLSWRCHVIFTVLLSSPYKDTSRTSEGCTNNEESVFRVKEITLRGISGNVSITVIVCLSFNCAF